MSEHSSKPSAPVARIHLGAVSLSIWENNSQDGRVFFTFGLQRSYQDQQGNWHNTGTFRPADCMALMTAVMDAYRWISTEGRGRTRDAGQAEGGKAPTSPLVETDRAGSS